MVQGVRAYLFEPRVLAEVVRMHVALPIEEQVRAVSATLHEVYGEHVTPGQPWMWSTAGGIMCSISVLHVSLDEYLLFCGTAIGSEGHSGRHRAEIYDVVMGGELWTYQPGLPDRKVYVPGELACLARGSANGSKLRPGTWLLEYARGNVPSLFPFALGDTLFSTLDTTDLVQQLGISAKLMSKEALLWLKQKQSGGSFTPNLSALKQPEANGSKKSKQKAGRADAN
jgi:C-8 sterol isomerase